MDDFEICDPRFLACVLPNAPLEKLGEGYRWLEGPVWFADLNCLLFSDIPSDCILRWSETGGVSVFRQPSHFANGHTRDREGRLIGCSHRDRCITRTELDGCITVLADRYQGKRLNSPNDVVVKSDGSIWFSDPPYGIQTDYEGGKQVTELPANLYRLDPRSGELQVMADDFQGPNGLCFSPDERRLYVSETGLQFACRPGATHPRLRRIGRGIASVQGTRIPQNQPRLCGWHALRHARQSLEQRWRWRALPRSIRRPARQDIGAIHGGQPELRRPLPQPVVPVRFAHAVCDLRQLSRCAMAVNGRVLHLLRVSRNVTDLARAAAFYREALGFRIAEESDQVRPAWAQLPDAARMSLQTTRLRLGQQEIELTAFESSGALLSTRK